SRAAKCQKLIVNNAAGQGRRPIRSARALRGRLRGLRHRRRGGGGGRGGNGQKGRLRARRRRRKTFQHGQRLLLGNAGEGQCVERAALHQQVLRGDFAVQRHLHE